MKIVKLNTYDICIHCLHQLKCCMRTLRRTNRTATNQFNRFFIEQVVLVYVICISQR